MIIGLTGKQGVGKNTVGDVLVDDYHFIMRSFARRLKELAIEISGYSFCQFNDPAFKDLPLCHGGQTPRMFLEQLGSLCRDFFGEDHWIEQYGRYADPDFGDYVITDVRYDNEAKWIKGRGGIVIKIVRDIEDNNNHPSNQGISNNLVDMTITNSNTRTLEEFKGDVSALISLVLSRQSLNN